jgi:hypothetical protein
MTGSKFATSRGKVWDPRPPFSGYDTVQNFCDPEASELERCD